MKPFRVDRKTFKSFKPRKKGDGPVTVFKPEPPKPSPPMPPPQYSIAAQSEAMRSVTTAPAPRTVPVYPVSTRYLRRRLALP